MEADPLDYQVFALAFKQEGAISYFVEHLPIEYVGLTEGKIGLQEFYATLTDFYKRTGLDPIDSVAFRSWLESESDIYDALGGAAHVSLFIDNIVQMVDISTPESVTTVLRHKAHKRFQMDSLQELHLILSRKDIKTDEDTKRIGYLTERIKSLENELGYDPFARVTTGLQMADHVETLWELPDFMPTQFPDLNEALAYDRVHGGLCRGCVYGVLALSGKGKSSFAKSLMNHWVDTGFSCLYVNFEEAQAHWERILFTQITKQNVYRSREMPAAEKEKHSRSFIETMDRWGDRFMVRHDPDTPYFEDLEKWLRDILIHSDKVPDIVIVDTIQSMFIKAAGGRPRWGQYEEMVVKLEKLAKDMNCVLIITAQENNNRLKDRREVVDQSDVGGSVTIAQKATATIFITEKKLASGDDSEDENIMQLQIPKNRITGTTFMSNPPMVRYDDETKTYYPFTIPTTSDYIQINTDKF